MIRFISIGTLLTAVWLASSLLTWVDVRDYHSDDSALIGTLIGSELNPLTGLVPLIVLLISMIARYRALSRAMAGMASMIAVAVVIVILLANWSDSNAVLELISSATGLATSSGFGVVVKSGYWIYLGLAIITAVIFAIATFLPGREQPAGRNVETVYIKAEHENLWDEQSN
jgi:hypothetical protein